MMAEQWHGCLPATTLHIPLGSMSILLRPRQKLVLSAFSGKSLNTFFTSGPPTPIFLGRRIKTPAASHHMIDNGLPTFLSTAASSVFFSIFLAKAAFIPSQGTLRSARVTVLTEGDHSVISGLRKIVVTSGRNLSC